jgi:stage III sporulation protein AG
MNRIKNLFQRIGKIKHIQIYIALILGVLICVACLGSANNKKSDNTIEIATEDCSTAEEYAKMLENKLCNVLSKVSGAGSVSVVITLESGFGFEYATNTETKTITSGDNETTVTTETVILVSNQPVIEKQNYPTIKGVVVVADGANDINVKLNIISAIETILQVDRQNITILA